MSGLSAHQTLSKGPSETLDYRSQTAAGEVDFMGASLLTRPPRFTFEQVTRLWLSRQGLLSVSEPRRLDRRSFVRHLEDTGGLQVDSVNVLDRAHYLTLWSRFKSFDRAKVDRWIYRDKVAYEYWGHEASILPISHLPRGMRRMRRFPHGRWANSAYWERYDTSPESKRRVRRLLTQHGPLESSDFERSKRDLEQQEIAGWESVLPKEDKRSLQLLWHSGKVAISGRRHFRKIYDLASRVYPEVEPVTLTEYHDSWLLMGLSGCGIASEKHLQNYITGPHLTAVIARNLRSKTIIEVRLRDSPERYFVLPEHLDNLDPLREPDGTTLICPFDSFLWQRKRAEELLGFRYRVEMYVPEKKRKFGYYVLPILHNGRLVGRLDPKFHRDRGCLEIKSLHYEPSFKPTRGLKRDLTARVENLAAFLGATQVDWTSP